MIGGLVEVAENGRYLSVHRGFLKVSEKGEELGGVPFWESEKPQTPKKFRCLRLI